MGASPGTKERALMTGTEQYNYSIMEGWGKLPKGWNYGVISAVACDSQDRVFVLTRGKHPLIILDREGNFLDSWGESVLKLAHGLFIDGADNVFCTDRVTHCIYQFNPLGEVEKTLGTPGLPGKEGEPFNIPTDVAVAPNGELYVSDGYGNRRVHKFSVEGNLLFSWGTQGTDSGQFSLPHSVRVDRLNLVWVCDRDNNRIQIFDSSGVFQKEITDMRHPDTLFFDPTSDVVYVAELDYQVSIYTLDGKMITCWGGGKPSDKPGEFLGWPHGIWLDSHRDLYVSEVNAEDRLQKFLYQPVSQEN
jgi:DNA-binding beta-propeller fold protein YncE